MNRHFAATGCPVGPGCEGCIRKEIEQKQEREEKGKYEGDWRTRGLARARAHPRYLTYRKRRHINQQFD